MRRICVAIALGLLALCSPITAQTTITGSLAGQVLDPSGAAIPDAQVQLQSRNTGRRLTTNTDGQGKYVFSRLEPGSYQLQVEKSGFQTATIEEIPLSINQSIVANIPLSVGTSTASVTVQARPEAVQSQTAEVSLLVDDRRLKDLPLNGKNYQRLVYLAPGVSSGHVDISNVVVSGARSVTNNYTLDGLGSNDERSYLGAPLDGGASSGDFGRIGPNLISTEALQEFRVITSNADASYGRGSGGQINAITKSGTNDFHGSVYDYWRNSALDARDFFNRGPFFNEDGTAKTPPFNQHLFGASLGGPIAREKHFFFGSFEGFRQRLEQTAGSTIPNAALINLMPGELRALYSAYYIDRGITPPTGNPTGQFQPLAASERAAAVAAGFPAALFDGDLGNGEAGTSLISTTTPRNIRQESVMVRTDHRLTDRLSLSARFAYARPHLEFNTTGLPGSLNVYRQKYYAPLIQAVYTVSPRQVIEVRGSVVRSESFTGNAAPFSEKLLSLGVNPDSGLIISASGNGLQLDLGGGHVGFIDNQTTPQTAVAHTWTRGQLTLRSGIDLRRLNINVRNTAAATPNYTFTNFVGVDGFLGASPDQAEAITTTSRLANYGANGGPPTPMRGWRGWQQEYFAQGDWRVRGDLTLNLGLRYSYFSVYSEADNLASNLYAVKPSGEVDPTVSPFTYGLTANKALPISDQFPLYQPDRNNFQPRIGAAWDIGGRGSTVIRAAYGAYIDRFYQLFNTNNVTNIPFATASEGTLVAFRLNDPVGVNASIPRLSVVDPTFRNPLTHRYNITIERKLTADSSVSVGYVGARAGGLPRILTPNGTANVPQEARPDQRFSTLSVLGGYASSRYDSLQMFGKQRFAPGIDLSIAYTFSRSKDNSSSEVTWQPSYPSLINLGASPAPGFQGGGSQFVQRPLSAEWANSDFDVRHNFVLSHVIDLPFGRGRRFVSSRSAVERIVGGWSYLGFLQLRSGEPFTVVLGQDVYDLGAANAARPGLLRGSLKDVYASGNRDRAQYLAPRSEALQILGTPSDVRNPFSAIGRNAFTSPEMAAYDASFMKRTALTEKVSLNFEINIFNVFNRAQFSAPVANLSSPLFGSITSTRAGFTPRQIQFGAKIVF
ncbi:MAG TPA: TonB-dependent receptor [Blastocatellia bacterium]|nr:TonB-dependent receptor [Blastocatellia bacterium]